MIAALNQKESVLKEYQAILEAAEGAYDKVLQFSIDKYKRLVISLV